jgi:hypothetical protein
MALERDPSERGGRGGRGDVDRPDPIASPTAPAPTAPPPPQPGAGEAPPEAGPAIPKPKMPPPVNPGATPLTPGTFQLPGQGAASAPFRTMDFLKNRFVSGQNLPEESMPLGTVPGGTATPRPIDPDELRRIFSQVIGSGTMR